MKLKKYMIIIFQPRLFSLTLLLLLYFFEIKAQSFYGDDRNTPENLFNSFKKDINDFNLYKKSDYKILRNSRIVFIENDSSNQIQIQKKNRGFDIMITKGIDKSIQEYIYLKQLHSKKISLLPFNSIGTTELYFDYLKFLKPNCDLTTYICDTLLNDYVNINNFSTFFLSKEDKEIISKTYYRTDYFLLYYFIFFHEFEHILSKDIHKKKKIFKKILIYRDLNDSKKYSENLSKLKNIEIKADSNALNKYALLLNRVSNADSSNEESKKLFNENYGICTPKTLQSITMLDFLENKNVVNKNIVTASERIFSVLKSLNSNINCSSKNTEKPNEIFQNVFIANIAQRVGNDDSFAKNLKAELEKIKSKKDIKDSLLLNKFYEEYFKKYVEEYPLSPLDSAENYLRGSNNFPKNLVKSFELYLKCANLLNSKTIKSIPKKILKFNEWEGLYPNVGSSVMPESSSLNSSINTILPNIFQKDKLNFIVALFYYHIYNDKIKAKTYLENISYKGFYVPQFIVSNMSNN